MSHGAAIVCVAAAVAALAGPAAACTCMPQPPRFLIADRTVLPADAVGVAWWGRLQWDGSAFVLPAEADFVVERSIPEGWERIGFRLVPLMHRLIGSFEPPVSQPIMLVAPDDGLVAGYSYRFAHRTRMPGGRDPRGAPGRWVVVHVIGDRLPRSAPGATVRVRDLRMGQAVTSTLDGGCSTRFLAHRAAVEMVLPPSLERWRDALLFTLRIDDLAIWRPDRSVCELVPPGLSSVGHGRELVFNFCGWWHEDLGRRGIVTGVGNPRDALPWGAHHLEYTAWLPGTPFEYVATGEVTLRCSEFSPR